MKRSLSTANSSIIDLLRVIATYSVLVGHGLVVYGFSISRERSYIIQNSGVIWLLLLSGFLTAYSLEKKAADVSFDYKTYVKSRIKRIYCEYVPALLLIALVDLVGRYIFTSEYPYRENYNIVTLICNLLMVHNTPFSFYKIKMFATGRPLWTLPAQWWLYLCYGKLFFIIGKRNIIGFKDLVFLGICMVVPISYLIDSSQLTIIFLCGVLAYYLYDMIKIKFPLGFAVLAFLLGIAGSLILNEAYNAYTYTCYMMCFILLLVFGKDKLFKRRVLLKLIADITFLVYLMHYSFMIFINFLKISKLNKLLVLVLISTLAAYSIYRLINYLMNKYMCQRR